MVGDWKNSRFVSRFGSSFWFCDKSSSSVVSNLFIGCDHHPSFYTLEIAWKISRSACMFGRFMESSSFVSFIVRGPPSYFLISIYTTLLLSVSVQLVFGTTNDGFSQRVWWCLDCLSVAALPVLQGDQSVLRDQATSTACWVTGASPTVLDRGVALLCSETEAEVDRDSREEPSTR